MTASTRTSHPNGTDSPNSTSEDLARCDHEIEEIRNRPDFLTAPSWLLTLGLMDWEVEKKLIEHESN